MRIFSNSTDNKKEYAIKKGTSVPSDAINLGWYNSAGISPKDNLNVIDVSSLIPENTVNAFAYEDDSIMYADEFGVLRFAEDNPLKNQTKFSPILDNSEISVSNKIIQNSLLQKYNFTNSIQELNSLNFAHSFYVSKYFTIQTKNMAIYSGLLNSTSIENPDILGIKVVDEQGNKYVDSDGKNKYIIYLEKYTPTTGGLNNTSAYYRVIVLLPDMEPTGLYLIYNKFEIGRSLIPKNQFLGFKEKINSVPFYERISEETEVMDPSSERRRVYSTQLFSHKENRVLKNKIDIPGWKAIVPRKAVQDPRTFQSFNWRLIARITYNFSAIKNIYSDQERPIVKSAVLVTNSNPNSDYPYIFNNMEYYPYNRLNYLFENPAATTNNKSSRSYWQVNLDDNSILNYDYDILYWTPTSPITANQALMLQKISAKNTSIFIDCSKLNLSGTFSGLNNFSSFDNFGTTFGVVNDNQNLIKLNDIYKNGETSFNGWNLDDFNEDTTIETQGIFGRRKNIDGSVKYLTAFATSGKTLNDSVKAIVSVNNNAIVLRISNNNSNISQADRSGIYLCSHGISTFLNDYFNTGGLAPSSNNNGENNSIPLGSTGVVYNNAIEGANKLFFNIITESSKNKVASSRITSTDSSVILHVSPWRSSWTINGARKNGVVTVLTDQEKLSYKFSDKTEITSDQNSSSAVTRFAREIFVDSKSSLTDIFQADFLEFSKQDASIVASDYNNVSFYIEITNDNVGFTNFSSVSSDDYIFSDISNSNNKFYKLSDSAFNQLKQLTTIPLSAYAKINSPEFDFADVTYPYMLVDNSEYDSGFNQTVKKPKATIGATQQIFDYNFDFAIQYSYKKTTEESSSYEIEWSIPFKSEITGTGNFPYYIITREEKSYPVNISLQEMGREYKTITNSDSPFNGYSYPINIYSRTDILSADQDSTSSVMNNFIYTADIRKSKRSDEYRVIYVSNGTTGISITKLMAMRDEPSYWSSSVNGNVSTSLKKDKAKFLSQIRATTSLADLKSDSLWSEQVFFEKNSEDVKTFSTLWNSWYSSYNYAINSNSNSTNSYKNYFGPSSFKNLTDQGTKPWSTQIEDFIKDNPHVAKIKKEQIVNVPQTNTTNKESVQTVIRSNNKTSKALTIKNEYVKYIQFTLNQFGYGLDIDGEYGPKTAEAVTKFQTLKSASFIDGIVDSETKSFFASYWLNLRTNQQETFNAVRNSAPDVDIRNYIDRALKYSDISAIGQSEYRRISFTGTKGPTKIVDNIILRVPSNIESLNGLTITSGKWNTIIKKVWAYTNDFVPHTIPSSADQDIISRDVNINIKANSSHKIRFNNLSGSNMPKWVMIRIEGDSIPNNGPYAEGFSIANIVWNATRTGVVETTTWSSQDAPVYATVEGVIEGKTIINTGEQSSININKSFSSIGNDGNTTISNVYFNSVYLTAEGSDKYELPAGTKLYHPTWNSSNPFYIRQNGVTQQNSLITYSGEFTYSLNPFDSISPTYSTAPTISAAKKMGAVPKTESTSNFSISTISAGKYVAETFGGATFNTEQYTNKIAVKNYKIMDADSRLARDFPLTVNGTDGLVVLTDSNLRPIGFPDFRNLINTVGGTTSVKAKEGTNIAFGFIDLVWNSSTIEPPKGLRWEFYNIRTSQFYGTKISYWDYIQDPNNIYIGLLAYDLDGDSGTPNIIGGDVYNIDVARVPTKIIAPLYSVKIKSRSKIGISAPPNDLSKFDSWFIEVGRGKFFKNINIPLGEYSSYLKNHAGKTLRCRYDTSTYASNYSPIFGTGFYDVYEEHPIILSDNQIQVRHGSFHVHQNQISKQGFDTKYTDAGPIEPIVKVSIKDSNGNWKNIDKNAILDFDKYNGTITFTKEIVPSNEFNIKVTYTVKNPNILLRHVDGKELPINPFSSSEIKTNNPVFIYVLPVEIQYLSSNGEWTTDTSYTISSTINWTTNYSIFDSTKVGYNPLALHIGTINILDKYKFENIDFIDLRVKGGGLSGLEDVKKIANDNIGVLSFSDIFSGKGYVYPNGGYVIVKIPKEVKEHFTSEEEIYSIVRSNLTAGVSFDIQDLDGNDWRTI